MDLSSSKEITERKAGEASLLSEKKSLRKVRGRIMIRLMAALQVPMLHKDK